MQHGTGREYVTDLLENVYAITTSREALRALHMALLALKNKAQDLDEPGVYGPDYGEFREGEGTSSQSHTTERTRTMLDYRDPNDDHESEYWDDYVLEFGVTAYFEARYGFNIETLEEETDDECL